LKVPETVEGGAVTNFRTMLPAAPEPGLFPALRKDGVKVVVESEEQPAVLQVLMAALPWVVIIGVWFAIAFFGWKFFMENPMAKTGNNRKKPGSDRKQPLPPST